MHRIAPEPLPLLSCWHVHDNIESEVTLSLDYDR